MYQPSGFNFVCSTGNKAIGIRDDNTVSIRSLQTYVDNSDIKYNKENLTYEDVLLLVGKQLQVNPNVDKSRPLLLRAVFERSMTTVTPFH